MHWVEIINARMTKTSEPRELIRLFKEIKAHVEALSSRDVRLAIYRHRLIENDWSIHLHWETDVNPSGKTDLGFKLAETIRPLAMVDHAIWVEEWSDTTLTVPSGSGDEVQNGRDQM